MQERFELVTGLSDHTIDNTTAITSVALGASIIEKHFTLSRDDKGPDSEFSLEPDELKRLCQDTKIAWESLGIAGCELKSSERNAQKHRRSLYFLKDIKAGELITNEHVKSIRPGFGLKPKYYEQALGEVAKFDIKRGTLASFDFMKNIAIQSGRFDLKALKPNNVNDRYLRWINSGNNIYRLRQSRSQPCRYSILCCRARR